MKQALHLRLGQHLTMTPQLQQAIKLLQLSTLELQTEIQEALDSNMMLEVNEDSEDNQNTKPESADDVSRDKPSDDDSLIMQQENIPNDLPVDSAWDDIYDAVPQQSSASREFDAREHDIPESSGESLHDHLIWQMELTPFSETDRTIAETIIDSINDDGYLGCNIEEILQSLPADLEVEADEVEAVLHRIQNFDPLGVAARDLRETLAIQLKHLPSNPPGRQRQRNWSIITLIYWPAATITSSCAALRSPKMN